MLFIQSVVLFLFLSFFVGTKEGEISGDQLFGQLIIIEGFVLK